ncbi:MAG: BMC domain-containing protein [Ignavibacteriae bacterium]|nr:BMC domain-containing protein [Ignavibacteriota bacterium]
MNLALGLIETKGLVGALEAADAMAKAASVKIIGKEKVTAGLMLIKVEGEVAAVKSAVDAGSAAAQRVGQLVSAHVIPRPAEQIDSILIQNKIESGKNKKNDTSDKLVVQKKVKSASTVSAKVTTVKKPIAKAKPEIKKKSKPKLKAISKPAVKVTSNESTSSKLPPLKELETLNVHTLRKLARGYDKFPIKGRDISKANRGKLLEYFQKIK